MPVELTMPQLGESVHEGTVSRWLKQVGEQVERYEPLVEIETDKVNTEIPSPITGALTAIVTEEGGTVPVGAVLAVLEPTDAPASGARASAGAPTTPASALPIGHPQARPARAVVDGDIHQGDAAAPRQPRRFTPVVLKMAAEHRLDLARVPGSGLGGRVTKQDVLAFLDRREPITTPVLPPTPTSRPVAATRIVPGPVVAPRDERIPLTATRRQIAERLTRSMTEIPHAGGMIEVDVSDLVLLRQSLHEAFEQQEGIALTYLPFVVKATVAGLKEFPLLNSQWGGDCIVLKRDINISIAVALEDSLVVPVLRGADGLSVAGIARAAADLAARARTGKLRVEDVDGGTFTVNNTGALGTIQSLPIINFPQAAILTSEAIVQRPMMLAGGAIAPRWMMNMCISFDHRIMDGLVVSRFLKAVRDLLEHPTQLGLY